VTGLALAGILASCGPTVPARPSTTTWADGCDQQASTVASSLAAAEQVVRLAADDRLPSRYGWVVLVQAEEAADRAATSARALQPPGSARAADRRVMRIVERAVAAVRGARIALVADPEPSARLAARLAADLERHQRAITEVALPSCAAVVGEGR
jgi:hypothetical protein